MATRRNSPCFSRSTRAFTFLPADSVRRTRPSPPSLGVGVAQGGEIVAGSSIEASLSPASRANQAPRHFNGVGEAPRVGLPLPRDAEGRAVVRARPHVRQAERDVDGLLKINGLERSQSLVVVKGDRDVELALQLAAEERVGGLAAGDPGDVLAQAVEDRVYQVALL